jgi:hypothetical protein
MIRRILSAVRHGLPLLLVGTMIQCGPSASGARVNDAELQIAAAVKAAPAEFQAGASVLGFAPDGQVVSIREGSNDLVCIADDPTREGWSVACYHASLEPFMTMGRELRAQGITDGGELAQRRWDAADAGTLAMPEAPAALYVLNGEAFDPATGEITSPYLRWVIYTPWATTESTGLASQPEMPGQPWLMFPGTAGAHIMISPPQTEE